MRLGKSAVNADNRPMSDDSKQTERGFQFPGVFEICAMGSVDADLPSLVPSVLEALGLTVVHKSLRLRPSSKGNFVSVTVSFEAHSRDDYDAAHGALRAQPAVKWTL